MGYCFRRYIYQGVKFCRSFHDWVKITEFWRILRNNQK
jgi:hypothetical protein